MRWGGERRREGNEVGRGGRRGEEGKDRKKNAMCCEQQSAQLASHPRYAS